MTIRQAMDNEFDVSSVIESLTINNLGEISYQRMLEILEPYILVMVPEEAKTDSDYRRLDYLLARTSNLYAYLRMLWAKATYERARLKKIDEGKAEDMQKKKEALYELGNAIKLKYEAISRKITLALENNDDSVSDRVDYNARRDARDDRQNQAEAKPKTTTTPATSPRARGGWSSLG